LHVSIDVKVDTKKTLPIGFFRNENFLNSFRPFCESCKGGNKVAISEHALFDVIRVNTSLEKFRLTTGNLGRLEVFGSSPFITESFDICHH